jgi:hypothetical protein
VIDLRYHIVSIVSIFLALAVGILLGAGPLQEDLGKTLTSQVSTLRDEKADLRSQLTLAERRVEAGEEFATTVTDELVGGQLAGRSVVLVTLPGADNDAATALTEVLTAAGADVNGTVGITSAWTDAATASARADVAESLGPTSTGDDTEPAEPDDRLAAALAGALLVPRVTDADKVTATTTATLNGLKSGDLVTFDGEVPELSTLAVVVAPAPEVPPATEPRRGTGRRPTWPAGLVWPVRSTRPATGQRSSVRRPAPTPVASSAQPARTVTRAGSSAPLTT